MAVGNAVLDVVLAPGFLESVEHIGLVMKQRLAELKDRHPAVIEDIRGEGLLVGIKCRVPNTDLASAARNEHLLTVPAGDNVLRLLPPLNIDETIVSQAVAMLDRAATAIEKAAIKGAAE
jgi:acetylornithine/N-succinyldiaminopimelate aminotransferase